MDKQPGVNQKDNFNYGKSYIIRDAIGSTVQQGENNIIIQSQQNPSLVEVTKEIMQLLQQFEKTNPNATELEKVAHVNDETAPSFKRRAVGALRSGGETAIDEFVLENKYLKVVKAIIIGWSKPD